VRRATSRKAILQAANKLFVKKGYNQTTVDDIARLGKLTKGAVYFYFKDKAAILAALLQQANEKVYDPIFLEMERSQADPTERMVRYVNGISGLAARSPESLLLPILMSIEFQGRRDRVGRLIEGMYARYHGALEKLIREGQEAGHFNTALPPGDLAHVMVSMNDGALLHYMRTKKHIDGEKFVRGLRMMILSALSRSAPDIVESVKQRSGSG
jgi:AcrR family transcriptional regulator